MCLPLKSRSLTHTHTNAPSEEPQSESAEDAFWLCSSSGPDFECVWICVNEGEFVSLPPRTQERSARAESSPVHHFGEKRAPCAGLVWTSERDDDARRERLPQHTAPDFWIWDRISEQIQALRNGEIEQLMMVKN